MFDCRSLQYGFTLIELLVVVAIIGLLAAIAVPQVSNYRNRAYAMSVRADVASAHKAVWIWFGDNSNGIACPSVPPVKGPVNQLSVSYPSASVSKGVIISISGGDVSTFRVSGSHVGLKPGNEYQLSGDGAVIDHLF